MATVKFNSVEEFLDELKKERGNTRLNILRLTNLFSPIPNLGPIRSLTVVATFKLREDIVCLNRYCGQLWDMEDQDKETYQRAEAIHKQIEEAAKPLGIEVRAGIWEE